MNDNILTLESRRAIVADLQIIGSSDPRSHHVYGLDHTTLQVTHKLLVTNRGPSFMPVTLVNIALPYMDKEDRELLESQNVVIKHADGTLTQCPVLFVDATAKEPSTASPTSPPQEPATTPIATSTPPKATDDEESVTFPFVEPSRRRRRQADKGSSKSREDGRVLQMDCQNYRCKTFQCSLTTLQRYEQAEINISVVLNVAVLPLSSKIDTVLYATASKVAEPPTPLFYRWTEPRSLTVTTPIYKVTSFTEISIWFIIGGVIGGLLTLVLIAVMLKKIGFFQREKRVELERLKRQNRFYQDRPRPPSTRRSILEQIAADKF